MTTPLELLVEGRIWPEVPFVEATEHGQALNFDIVLSNRGDSAVELTQLEVTFVGSDGYGHTRRIDRNGIIPAIEAVPSRRILPHQSRLIFNPVEYAPMEPPVVAARVVATLSAGDSSLSIAMHAPACRCEPALFLLPLVGRVWVWDGHDHLSHHRRWDYTEPWVRDQGYESNPMRYAYDLVTVDVDGRHHRDDGSRNEDYLGFGLPVRAPAAGLIIEVTDDRPDDGSWEVAESAEDPNSLLGNRVVIDHEDETFSHLAHIRQGSATVTVGQRVDAGDHLGAVGNSGSSIFPHLHYQRADAPTMLGEGVPSTFTNIVLDRGNRPYPINGHIDSGDILHAE